MMSRQKFFTKALFICAICAAYFAASFFLGASEAAGRKNRNRPKFPAPPATGFQSTIDNRQLAIENGEPSTAFLPAAPADGECGISGFVMDYKERTEVAGAKLQARLTTGRQKLLTEYSEDDGFYCFSGLKNGKYTINTKKSGYQNNTKKLEYKGELLEADIYLKCKSSEGCADSSGGSSGGGSGGGSGGSTSGGSTSGGTTGGTSGDTGSGTSGGATGGTTGGGSTGGTYITPSFKDNRDGTVTDSANKLMWQQGEFPRTYNWYQASGTYDAESNSGSISVCGSLIKLAGYSNWRLPTIDELRTLLKATGSTPAIDTTFFPNASYSTYWSSTVYDTSHAWRISFHSGDVYYDYEFSNNSVRCVRGGQ